MKDLRSLSSLWDDWSARLMHKTNIEVIWIYRRLSSISAAVVTDIENRLNERAWHAFQIPWLTVAIDQSIVISYRKLVNLICTLFACRAVNGISWDKGREELRECGAILWAAGWTERRMTAVRIKTREMLQYENACRRNHYMAICFTAIRVQFRPHIHARYTIHRIHGERKRVQSASCWSLRAPTEPVPVYFAGNETDSRTRHAGE